MIKIDTKNEIGKVVINDFSKTNSRNDNLKSEIGCDTIYNFNNNNGVLKKGMGVRPLMVYAQNDLKSLHYELDYFNLAMESFNKVMYFKQYFASSGNTTHRLLFHGSDKKLYLFQMFSNLNMLNWVYELEFDTIPAVLEYKKDGLDSILISSTDKLVVWSTGKTPYEISNVPTITSMCVYNDELYCTIAGESDKIWYTSTLDPESVGTESDKTKYLTLPSGVGGGRKIIMLKENMYVFCDYGITRLNTYAKKETKSNHVYVSNCKIYPNTVVLCGDFVMFVTRDGLYKFNGTSVSKVDVLQKQLQRSFNEYAVATHLGGNYYLALNIDFQDDNIVGCEYYGGNELKNNALIKLNLHDYSFEILRGIDVKDMLSLQAGIEEKVVLTFNSGQKNIVGEIFDEGDIFNENCERRYVSNYIVQEDMEPITIRSVKIDASEKVVICIISEHEKVRFKTYCDGLNEFQTIIPCKKFKIDIEGQIEDCYINSVEIEYVKRK